jgi:hypothetical protein
MFKATPNPPETDNVSPYESLDSKKLHDAANRALDHYLNPSALKSPVTRKPSTMYMVAPDIKDEDLLAHTCESLAQASVMASDIAGYLEGPHRLAPTIEPCTSARDWLAVRPSSRASLAPTSGLAYA